MKTPFVRLLWCLLFVGVYTVGTAANLSLPDKFGTVARGTVVSDFAVTGAEGQAVRLSAFRGRNVLVQFCTSEGPTAWFSQIASNYAKEKRLVLLAVFTATPKAGFDQWLAAHPNPSFSVAWDPAGQEGIANQVFGVNTVPATAFIKADGTLSSGVLGTDAKLTPLVFLMIASNGVKIRAEDEDAVVAAINPGATQARPANSSGGARPARPPLLENGAIAPDFLMHDVNGREVHLANHQGEVVILDFWATWCGPCIKSFPHTQKIAAKYKDQNVVVLASGTSDSVAAFKQWIPTNQPKYPDMHFAFDPNERGSATFNERASAKLYRVSGIPTQFVIGRDGKIVAGIVGYGGETDLRTEVALARAGVKVAPEILAQAAKHQAEHQAAP
jgi:thiol-disulfide isomerase/thioredoxin